MMGCACPQTLLLTDISRKFADAPHAELMVIAACKERAPCWRAKCGIVDLVVDETLGSESIDIGRRDQPRRKVEYLR